MGLSRRRAIPGENPFPDDAYCPSARYGALVFSDRNAGQPRKTGDRPRERHHVFAASRPWRGTLKQRKAKFRTAIREICAAAGAKPPRMIFAVDEETDSGRSCCVPALGLIVLRGRLSVITALHEIMHLLHGSSERTAVARSLALFRAAFPRSFRRLTFSGHMAVARPED